MNIHVLRVLAGAGLLLAASALPALAQAAGGEPSLTCRLFPLACPGPTPPPPPPLLGPPEAQSEMAPPAKAPAKHRAKVRKHPAKAAAQ